MNYQIINSDVYAGLYYIPSNSIDVAITSPPYWGQRDYGFIGQIGNEKTFYEYINRLVTIFSLLKEKLNNDGVFFLNIGDKYLSKYGKSPLAFIPYKLATSMINDGWILNDIFIWYKPNHMPSSVKNRFTNSYEPIFVFSKQIDNVFQRKNRNKQYSNILKIMLQPSVYKHVAVYPEKLVAQLLDMVDLKPNSVILDPFAGSGTTLKVVKEISPSLNAIMIENHSNYIDIIKQRCNLNGQIDIKKYDFIPYNFSFEYQKNNIVNNLSFFEKKNLYNKLEIVNKKGIIKIFDDISDYYELLDEFLNNKIKIYLDDNATCFIGSKEFDIELIYKTSFLNDTGWVIRNMIIIENGLKWFPIFMLVDDNKKTNYVFNYKKLNIKSKYDNNKNWNLIDFSGYKVINSIDKLKQQGRIVKVLNKRDNGFPEYVLVLWDDGKITKEFVVYSQEEINNNILFNEKREVSELKELTKINNEIDYSEKLAFNDYFNHYINKDSYTGKFKYEVRKNWGASPGARASLVEEYFTLKRLYDVDQKIVADYLNHKRLEKGLSKQALTNFFPKNYKHTVGHWLRNDFGGSIPTKSDWFILKNILDIDDNMTNYVCKYGLKLQIVQNADYKTPDDFQSFEFLDKLNLIID